MSTVLITGASGLIGKRLTTLLIEKGYTVSHLSRHTGNSNRTVKVYTWDVKRQIIDKTAIANADYIIHLAGANLPEGRWTTKRKKEFIDSRVQSADLLFKTLQQTPTNKVKAIISASGIGYYGDRKDELLTENSPPGSDFLSSLCQQWEEAIQQFTVLKIRPVSLRTGIVLAKEGGALPELVTPVKFGVAPLFGMGKPYYSWIHLDDMCGMYIHLLENEMSRGAYNAAAPQPVRHRELMNAIRRQVNRFSIPFPVPTFILRIMVGELGATLDDSINVSSERIQREGFQFKFTDLDKTVKDLLTK